MTTVFAVGAEWCRYSSKQDEEITKIKDGSATNVHMVMCQDGNKDLIKHVGDDDWKNEVCRKTKTQIQGFPTWFKQDATTSAVSALSFNGQGLHYLKSQDICTRLAASGESCES